MTEKNKPRQIGRELVSRLERFTKQLETCENLDDLSKVLTVHTVRRDLPPKPFSADEFGNDFRTP